MTRKINNSYLLGQSNAPTTGGDMLKTRSDGTLVWEGVEDYTFVPVSWYGGTAVFGGGYTSAAEDTIDYLTMATTGNATDFGNLLSATQYFGSCSNGSRILFTGGTTQNVIQYITVASTGDAIDFGDLPANTVGCASVSDGTRGLIGGGGSGSGGADSTNVISYVIMGTTGNATDFGDLTVVKSKPSACTDGTKGVWLGGSVDASTMQDVIDYVTISTTGNATDFGNLSSGRQSAAACSDDTRGINGGGYNGSAYINVLEYITIASTGNSTDFGDFSATVELPGACSDGTKGLWAHGLSGGSTSNIIEYVTMQTTGNSTDFGDLTVARYNPTGSSGD